MAAFSAMEILKMAEKAEQNAAAFYRRAANAQQSLPVRDTLMKLSRMEEEHRASFAGLIKKAGERAFEDPYGDLQLYLNAVVEMHGGEGSMNAEHTLTGKESLHDVVGLALGAEAKSILYYEGLRDMLTDEEAKQILTKIIGEEKTHMAALQGLLQ